VTEEFQNGQGRIARSRGSKDEVQKNREDKREGRTQAEEKQKVVKKQRRETAGSDHWKTSREFTNL
jgi:hypothetical protein